MALRSGPVRSAGCTNLHHEVELGVIIGRGGSDIAAGDAMSHVAGYVVALDMTARELQEVAKKRGEPWSVAKGSDTGQLSRSSTAAAAAAGPNE